MKLAIVMGTRPEIIKLSPIINKLSEKSCSIIFTGQHYDYNMSLQFLKNLGIRNPDYKMKLTKLHNTTTGRAIQSGEIMINLAKIISKIEPDTVVVQGDTNTVLASSIASLKCNIPVSHVEAGLRSYDWRMPEEHNRIAVDHISELLFAPTKFNKKILTEEKVHGKIFVTGNTAIDAVCENIKKIDRMKKISIDSENFVLLTLHRGENVDNSLTLTKIMKALIQSKTKLLFPIHPRTLKRLKQFGLLDKVKNSTNITLLPPIGYFDMLYLMKKCTLIISDSGGIQEEATAPPIRKKVLVLRDSTERIEAVKDGYSEIIGTNPITIIRSIQQNIDNPIKTTKNPYGNGKASNKIIQVLRKNF